MYSSDDLPSFPDYTLRRQLTDAIGEYAPGPVAARAPVLHGKKRFTEILHNFCDEPLPWYKKLETSRPRWPTAMRKFTAKDGFRVADTHNIEVPSCDKLQRAKKGLLRTSSGMVNYSALDRMPFELDAGDIIKILREREPHILQGKLWSVKKLEKAYQTRFRRQGSWARQGVPFKVFLSLFPKTFDLFGADQDYIRLVKKSRLSAVDSSEDAMVSLALACEQGYVDRTAPLEGTMRHGQEHKTLPELAHVRTKTMFRSTSDPGLRSHTLPAIRERQDFLDASFKLPQIKASTLPAEMPFRRTVSGTGSDISTVRISDMHETRSTFRVSFMVDHEGSRSATPVVDL